MELKPNTKKNTIWSNTLIESNLCDDLICTKFDKLEEKKQDLKQDRSIESYDYTEKPFKTTTLVTNKNHLSSIDYNRAKLTIEADLVKPVNKTLSERIGPLVQFDESKSRDHILANEFDNEELVTKEIVKHLKEPKSDLIKRVVTVLGRKKALELLYATEDIQNNGGMLTTEGDRYRTPGGVYIQLLRKDDTVLNCQRKKIFIEEAERKKKLKQLKRLNQQKRFDLAKKQLKEKVLAETADNVQEDNEKEIEDDLNEINEDNMIYFE